MISVMPRISEKSYMLASSKNTYMFDVPLSANKSQIKEAIEAQYGVSVTGVRTAIIRGKVKSTPVRRRYPIQGKRSDVKRAYVTLKKGDNIPVFEEV